MDTNNNTPFAPIAEPTNNEAAATPAAPAFAPAAPQKPVKYTEAPSAFAEGLPEWNLEPPQVMVRRR